MKSKVITICFAGILALLAILNFATPPRYFSDQENRVLQQMPAFSWQRLASGKYTAEIDAFVTDQFVGRDQWVGIKTLTEKLIGRRSSNGVYFGKDGYLIEMFDTVDTGRFAANLEYVKTFSEMAQRELGVRVDVMLAPTASFVLTDKLPAHTPEVDQPELFRQAAGELSGLVDVRNALSARSEEYIYYKTDHHWTSLGAYYAYAQWREARGESAAPPEVFRQEVLSDQFYGTTYSKASLYTAEPDVLTAYVADASYTVEYNLGETVTDTIYERSYLEKKDKYSVFFNANQPVTVVKNKDAHEGSLLIIKDSYANTFAQMTLGDYQTVHMLDLRYFHTSVRQYVEDNGITDVLVLYSVKNFAGDTNLYYITT